jgi:c-di-GMP-binding flagellar brake protein YcgR
MHEKRKRKRRYPIYYIRVFNQSDNSLIGRLVNYSPGGMMLVSEKPVKINTDYQFRMELPPAISNRKEVTLEAKSVWCDLNHNPDFYDTGYKFNNIPEDVRRTIDKVFQGFPVEN